MAEYLDKDLPIVEPDPITGELKATAYFEDLWYRTIRAIGGEGSTLVSDLAAVTFESDRFYSYTGLIQRLTKQVHEIQHTINSPILDAKLKSMERKLSQLEDYFNVARLEGVVKQLEVDTQGFRGRVEVSNYTAINKDWVEARSGIIVKLPANPDVNDQVIVSNGDGSKITIQGNGNTIKYTTSATSIITRNQGTSLHFQLFQDEATKYWRIR